MQTRTPLPLFRRGTQLQGPVHGLTAGQWSRSGSPETPSPPSFSCWVEVPISSLEIKAPGLQGLWHLIHAVLKATERCSSSALSSAEVNVSLCSSGSCCFWHLPWPLLCSHWLINFRWHLHQQPGNRVPSWSSLSLACPRQGQDISGRSAERC